MVKKWNGFRRRFKRVGFAPTYRGAVRVRQRMQRAHGGRFRILLNGNGWKVAK